MARDYYIEVEGRRTPAKALDHIPRAGEIVWLTPYGRVRATRHVVVRVEWSIAQEESAAYFNRPRQVVIHLEPEAGAIGDEPSGG